MFLPRPTRLFRRRVRAAAQVFALFWLVAGMHLGHHLFHRHESGHAEEHACCTAGHAEPMDGADAPAIDAPCPICLLTVLGGSAGVVLPSLAVFPPVWHGAPQAPADQVAHACVPSRNRARGPPAIS